MKKIVKNILRGFAAADKQIKTISSSKIFVGIVIICLNVASKFTTIKLSPATENFLRTGFAWQILVFCFCYMGTRCVYTSVLLTLAFIVVTQYLCNEESQMCLLPAFFREKYQNGNINESSKIELPNKVDIEKAIDILTKISKNVDGKNDNTTSSTTMPGNINANM
jgi:hypothetical protein